MKKRDPLLAKGWGQIVTPLSLQTMDLEEVQIIIR
jgi:hypothetical protein